MKKSLILIFCLMIILGAVSGCSAPLFGLFDIDINAKTGRETTTNGLGDVSKTEKIEGILCEGERFSVLAPKDWEIMEMTYSDGFQLYKLSGEVIQIQYAGYNQRDDAAQKDVESFASRYSGTEPKEVEMLGKTFWMTIYEFNGAEQTLYARMEDGVKLTIQTAKGNYENNAAFRAIIDTVEFK